MEQEWPAKLSCKKVKSVHLALVFSVHKVK